MPRLLLGVNLAIFRTWIASRSIDLTDARALVRAANLVDGEASRITDSRRHDVECALDLDALRSGDDTVIVCRQCSPPR